MYDYTIHMKSKSTINVSEEVLDNICKALDKIWHIYKDDKGKILLVIKSDEIDFITQYNK